MFKQSPADALPCRTRVDIELLDPLVVQHNQGGDIALAISDPDLTGGKNYLFEPVATFLISMDGWGGIDGTEAALDRSHRAARESASTGRALRISMPHHVSGPVELGQGCQVGLMSMIGRMGRPTVQNEETFHVARIQAVGGPTGAPEAFRRLEERLESLRGSKMYGCLYPGEPPAYFACFRLDGDHSDDLGFDHAEVPGGLYGRRLVKDWENKLSELPGIFDQFQADLVEADFLVDVTRPSLEFYRRSNELLIMVPVLPGPVDKPI